MEDVFTERLPTVTLSRQYDTFGNPELGNATEGFAYTGREWDAETGLYYYRARYYDSKTARFLSEDPIGFNGGLNLYSYADNEPVTNVDPFGWAPGDNRFGLSKEFWRWYHRQYKPDGGDDIDTYDQAKRVYKEWQDQGEPDGEGHRTKPTPRPAPDPSRDKDKAPDNKRTTCLKGCPERLVPVLVVTGGVAVFVAWKTIKTCACTLAGGPLAGGACLVTQP